MSVGAVFGAHTARGRHVPLFAVLLAGLVAGLGGGIARDVLLGIEPAAIANWYYVPASRPRRHRRLDGPQSEPHSTSVRRRPGRGPGTPYHYWRPKGGGLPHPRPISCSDGRRRGHHRRSPRRPPHDQAGHHDERRAFHSHDSAQFGVALMTRKLLQLGMGPPVIPMSAGIRIWRLPARPWIC
jgi:hypothetical protein